jgi:hypothetical protein
MRVFVGEDVTVFDIADGRGRAGHDPPRLKAIPTDVLLVRDQKPSGEELDTAVAELTKRIDAFCASESTHEPNRRLVKHVTRERDNLLTFLTTPRVQATNWRAE